ncbi:MAG: TolC family protein [Luteimonas sp.]
MSVLFSPRRRRRHALAGIALACVFSLNPAWAAPPVVGFDEAIRLAVERAPELDARRSQTEAARHEAVRAAALPDPKLSAGIDNLPVTGSDAFDFGADMMTMKRIGLIQEFPARAKRQARQALADRTVDQAQALTVAEQLAVRQSAAQAWVSLWAAERELGALTGLRDQSALAVRISKAQLSGGGGTAVDTLAAQSAALELESRIEAAEAAVDAARGSLARWLGRAPEGLSAEGAPPDFNTLPSNESTLLASVDRIGPLLAWQAREAVAEAQVSLASAEKRPDWSIGAGYGQREGGRSDMLTIEFSIGLPLFTANRQDRGVAARRAELEAVAFSREDARRAQIETIRRALAQWKGLKRQIELKEQQQLPLARDRAQVAIASYGGGGELQPWLLARRDELELHIGHARHLGELGRAWAALAFLLPAQEAQR